MENVESNSLLHTAELVHWAALGFMGLVYLLRLSWLLRHKAGKDRQKPGDHGDTSVYPALYSMANVAMPWAMESTRKNFPFYLSFVIFHIGVVAGIFVAFVSGLYRPLLEMSSVANALMVVIGAAFVVSLIRILRRLASPVLRLISTPDDYFSLLTLTIWFATGTLCMAFFAGRISDEIWLVAHLFATSFFLVYVPFSKISHYLYYPFTRYYIGKTLGHRGSLPVMKG